MGSADPALPIVVGGGLPGPASKVAPVKRRAFLKAGLATVGGVVMGPAFWERAFAAPSIPGPSPYGPLQRRDANGLMLPEGFTSRVIARSGTPVVPTPYVYPPFPDGSHTFATSDGGWIHVVNSEFPVSTDSPVPDAIQRLGGASAIRFDAAGEIVDAYRILGDTRTNCAGGATPWGTWLSCEEFDDSIRGGSTASAGLVWECDPTGKGAAVAHPTLGAFKHEAAAVDPSTNQVYLTEDVSDGRFYRFTPSSFTGTAKDFAKGRLQVAQLAGPKAGPWEVTWLPVADPSAVNEPTRYQAPRSTAFDGGEGCFLDSGIVYVTTKGDNRAWRYHIARKEFDVLYDAADHRDRPTTPLSGVDNIIVSRSGDIFVAEDQGNMEVVMITPGHLVAPVVRAPGYEHGLIFNPLPSPLSAIPLKSEITGLAFSPDGSRLYFNSQRAFGLGLTYEVTGPFRQSIPAGERSAF